MYENTNGLNDPNLTKIAPLILSLSGLLILLLFTLFSCAGRDEILTAEQRERELFRELGVKTQTKWSHGVVNQVRHYDQRGRIIDEKWYNPKGVVVTRRVLEYERNSVEPAEIVWYKGREVLKSRYLFSYDRKGRLKEEKWLTPFDEIQTRTVYHYDNGNMVKAEKFDRFENTINTSLYSYENGFRTEFIEKDRRGNIVNRHKYQYDGEGNLLVEKWFAENDEVTTERYYEYDNNILIEQREYQEGRFFHLLSYEYYSNDLLLYETWMNDEEEIFFRNNYTYEFH